MSIDAVIHTVRPLNFYVMYVAELDMTEIVIRAKCVMEAPPKNLICISG